MMTLSSLRYRTPWSEGGGAGGPRPPGLTGGGAGPGEAWSARAHIAKPSSLIMPSLPTSPWRESKRFVQWQSSIRLTFSSPDWSLVSVSGECLDLTPQLPKPASSPLTAPPSHLHLVRFASLCPVPSGCRRRPTNPAPWAPTTNNALAHGHSHGTASLPALLRVLSPGEAAWGAGRPGLGAWWGGGESQPIPPHPWRDEVRSGPCHTPEDLGPLLSHLQHPTWEWADLK